MEGRKRALLRKLSELRAEIPVVKEAYGASKALAEGLMKHGGPRSRAMKSVGRAKALQQKAGQLSAAEKRAAQEISQVERACLVLSGRFDALRAAMNVS